MLTHVHAARHGTLRRVEPQRPGSGVAGRAHVFLLVEQPRRLGAGQLGELLRRPEYGQVLAGWRQ